MKKVYCLYRVASKSQNECELLVQKAACRQFVSIHSDWHIEREYFKNAGSCNKVMKRETIQKSRFAVIKSDFDILLMHRLNRLGHQTDEVTFLIERFNQHDVEVWDTLNGHLYFHSHSHHLQSNIHF